MGLDDWSTPAVKVQRCWRRYAARQKYEALRQARLSELELRFQNIQHQEHEQYLELVEADEELQNAPDPVAPQLLPHYEMHLLLADERIQRETIIRCEGHYRSRLSRLMNHEGQAFCEDEPVFQTNKERRRRMMLQEEQRQKTAEENRRLDFLFLQEELESLSNSEERERAALEVSWQSSLEAAVESSSLACLRAAMERERCVFVLRQKYAAIKCQRRWRTYWKEKIATLATARAELEEESKLLLQEEKILRTQVERLYTSELLGIKEMMKEQLAALHRLPVHTNGGSFLLRRLRPAPSPAAAPTPTPAPGHNTTTPPHLERIGPSTVPVPLPVPLVKRPVPQPQTDPWSKKLPAPTGWAAWSTPGKLHNALGPSASGHCSSADHHAGHPPAPNPLFSSHTAACRSVNPFLMANADALGRAADIPRLPSPSKSACKHRLLPLAPLLTRQ